MVNYVVGPVETARFPQPKLVVLESPFRRLFNPLFEFIGQLQAENPDRLIAVVISELVEPRWYHYLLHNQRATALKAALLLRGNNRVIVISVPWYLGPKQTGEAVER